MSKSPNSLHVLVITPAPAGSTLGNRVTAMRWAKFLRELGHRVTIATNYDGKDYDLLIALHAVKSGDAISAFRANLLGRPMVVMVTGTDLYVSAPAGAPILGALELANAIVVLQERTIADLPEHFRQKARAICQSVEPSKRGKAPFRQKPAKRSQTPFDICVLAHLRAVKDPLRAAVAARRLPEASRVQVKLAGAVIEPKLEKAAIEEAAFNERFEYLGELSHSRAMTLLAKSRLLVVSSFQEGGPNVISEACALGVPVLATKVSGNIGLLGEDYGGYFPPGDDQKLAALMARCESDAKFYAKLQKQVQAKAPLFAPAREKAAIKQLVEQLVPPVVVE
ncbi:MAG: TIGR04348 family glycosyltransferase [Planctomycetes bacterium]|nr:TIGR04348 family glycosyltransferase [Planctomycetota bacterium]